MSVTVRFAPSPTGYLHVGNARIALVNYLFARHHGGRFLLRFDDTDPERSREVYREAILHDLAWLGLSWEESFRQSERRALYEEAAARLKAAGRLYPCYETEEELRFRREQRRRRGLPPVYDRAALRMSEAERRAAEARGRRPYWRFRLSEESIAWQDLVLGRREVKLTSVSDPVLIRADGTPLYTFTSVVDDIERGVTHVLRGEDHVTNTAVQHDLFAALGARPPAFGHLPLLVDAAGGKLSKRLEGLSLRSLRRDGIEPRALAAYLVALGSARDPEPLALEELARSFSLAAYAASPPRFDPRQLLALNRRVLQGLTYEEVRGRLPAGAGPEFWEAVRGNIDLFRDVETWWRVVKETFWPPGLAHEADFLRRAAATLPPEPWDEGVIRSWLETLKREGGRQGRALLAPLRLALTGETAGPELARLLPLIGRTETLARLERAARTPPAEKEAGEEEGGGDAPSAA